MQHEEQKWISLTFYSMEGDATDQKEALALEDAKVSLMWAAYSGMVS